MDTKKIALLMDVVKIGSLKRAAEALNYTQSGLIYQINSLEQEIGVPLLVRNHKGVSLTQAGKTLEPLFQNLIDNSARLRMEVEAFTQKRGNEIRLGAVPSALSGRFSAVLRSYLESTPEMKVSIYSGTDELKGWLDSELIDAAIVVESLSGDYEWLPLYSDVIYACIPAYLPIAEKDFVTFDDLRQYTILVTNYEESSAFERLRDELGTSLNEKNVIQVSNAEGAALFPLVGSGLGITFLSDAYLDACPPSVRMLPIEPSVHRSLGMILSPGRHKPAALKQFASYLHSHMT